jgi:hypothetical protein
MHAGVLFMYGNSGKDPIALTTALLFELS